MMRHRPARVAIAAAAVAIAGHAAAVTPARSKSEADRAAVRRWNGIAGDAVAIDHTPTQLFPAPEQVGPTGAR